MTYKELSTNQGYRVAFEEWSNEKNITAEDLEKQINMLLENGFADKFVKKDDGTIGHKPGGFWHMLEQVK